MIKKNNFRNETNGRKQNNNHRHTIKKELKQNIHITTAISATNQLHQRQQQQ